jgi:hypothetical protein
VIMIHDFGKNPVCVDKNLIRSQCVVAVVKRLRVLATCHEIWKAVSLVTNRPEEWTYPPPTTHNLVFRTRTDVWEYVPQRMRVHPTVTHTVGVRFTQRTGVRSCSHATGVRPAHWMCVWSYSCLWWH